MKKAATLLRFFAGLLPLLCAGAAAATTVAGPITEPGVVQIQDEGSNLTKRRTLDFIGSAVSCVDNSTSSRTDCTITGGGGGATVNVPPASVLYSTGGTTISGDTGFQYSSAGSSITLKGSMVVGSTSSKKEFSLIGGSVTTRADLYAQASFPNSGGGFHPELRLYSYLPKGGGGSPYGRFVVGVSSNSLESNESYPLTRMEFWNGDLSSSGEIYNYVDGALTEEQRNDGTSYYLPVTYFSGITIDGLSGVLKASAGTVSGSATTSDLPEGSNLYYTNARATSSVSATFPLLNTNGVFSADSSSFTMNGPSIDLGSSEATGTLAAARFPALTGNVTTSAGSLATTIVSVPSTVLVSSFPVTGVPAGTYGSETQVSSFTVNAQGGITGAANVTISLTNSNLQSGTYSNVTVPAANVAAGSLGPSVLTSSLNVTGVTPGTYTNTTVTFDAQGRATSASSNTTPTFSSATVTGPLTLSSTTVGLFELVFDPCQSKLPGANSPYIQNSTGEASCSVYFDDTSTQSITRAGLTTRYDGRTLYAEIIFTSTATSGTVNWAVYTDTKSTTSNYDTNNFNVAVTTSVTVNPVSNAPTTARVALTNTTTVNGQMVIYKFERMAGLNDSAVGYAKPKVWWIHE